VSLNAVSPAALEVLLAERNDDARLMYAEYFRHSNVHLDEASDGRQALAKALARPHDVIITETRLPGINGYELIDLLRHDTATHATPIVVVTADAFTMDVDRAGQAGADTVLLKPCLPAVLLAEATRLWVWSKALQRRSRVLRDRVANQLARSASLHARLPKRALSRTFVRTQTTDPPMSLPTLLCPTCDQTLFYLRSHVGGVSERHREQWDYWQCPTGCGTFQYRQRTRRLRQVS